MPYYKNGMKAAFSIVLLLTKIQKGFIKFLEPADCGMFCPNSIAVVRYGALIRAKSPTNCDAHLAESPFQTCSRPCTIMKSAQFADEFFQAYSGGCLLLAVRAVCRRQKKCLKWYKVNCIRRQRR